MLLLIYILLFVFKNRIETAIHYIARAPFKPGRFTSNWAWRDEDLPPAVLEEIRRGESEVKNPDRITIELFMMNSWTEA